MQKNERDPRRPTEPQAARRIEGLDDAFGLWLQTSLHRIYGSVADEPIPPELLKLIEESVARRNR